MQILSALKNYKRQPRPVVVAAIAIICLIVLLFFLRGFIRVTVIPGFVGWRHEPSLNSSLAQVNKELGSPLQKLEVQQVKAAAAHCSLNTAYLLYAEVGCSASQRGETAVVDDKYIQANHSDFENLQTKFTNDGWRQSQSVGTPMQLTQLLTGTDNAMGTYRGFIRFDKKVDGNNCWVDFSRFETFHINSVCMYTGQLGP